MLKKGFYCIVSNTEIKDCLKYGISDFNLKDLYVALADAHKNIINPKEETILVIDSTGITEQIYTSNKSYSLHFKTYQKFLPRIYFRKYDEPNKSI